MESRFFFFFFGLGYFKKKIKRKLKYEETARVPASCPPELLGKKSEIKTAQEAKPGWLKIAPLGAGVLPDLPFHRWFLG